MAVGPGYIRGTDGAMPIQPREPGTLEGPGSKMQRDEQRMPYTEMDSASDALAAMRSVGITELDLGDQTTRLVSGGGRDARRILRVTGIKQISPPSTGETTIDSLKMPT